MTAAELLAALHAGGYDPEVDGGELVLAADPSDALAAPLEVLRTGVLAVLTGRPWWGCDGDTGRTLALDQRQRLPANVSLLGVGGEAGWDRLHPCAALDLPGLFAPAPPTNRVKRHPL
jgi:hypothetical protein